MKHFTQFIHLLRAAWEGDRQRAAEQVLALADQMEGEGDAAHARMLRFTLQALQNHPPVRDGQNSLKPTAPPRAAAHASTLDVDLGAPAAAGAPTAPPLGAGTVALTFGTWDETRH
jgi:hypothetical protein